MISYWRSIVTISISHVVSEIFNVEKYRDLEIQVKSHSRSSEPTPIDPPPDFLLTFHSNYGPISYRFPDKRRFQSKMVNFPTPVYFASPLKGFPLELGIGVWGRKLEYGATGPNKKFDDIFSRLDTMHQRDGRTDWQTRDDSKDRLYA